MEDQVVTLEAPTTTQQADPFGNSWTETPTEVAVDKQTSAVPDTPAATTDAPPVVDTPTTHP